MAALSDQRASRPIAYASLRKNPQRKRMVLCGFAGRREAHTFIADRKTAVCMLGKATIRKIVGHRAMRG
jgi:hypothetical protein